MIERASKIARFSKGTISSVWAEKLGRDLYNVRWIRSYWSADRLRMICEYEAADVASVRNVQREADARFERAWAADVLGGP